MVGMLGLLQNCWRQAADGRAELQEVLRDSAAGTSSFTAGAWLARVGTSTARIPATRKANFGLELCTSMLPQSLHFAPLDVPFRFHDRSARYGTGVASFGAACVLG
ncbi:unnamed protein product [Symbiodinium natans]|uniref:Uncharacterized protein n=1 Tax=Symbiodinium natans TaxID=878477 RepID=A0A812VBY8_9DINO|nr:unnamed protein product [Symbiodinium natans]